MKTNSTDIVAIATILAAVVVAVLALTSSAHAEQPCRPDVQKLCSTVQPGGGRIVSCLKQHESQLSPQCLKEIAGAKQSTDSVIPK